MNTIADDAWIRALVIRISLTAALLLLGLFAIASGRAHAAVAQPAQVPLKGLAQADWGHNEDRAALGASWWYAWGDGNCSEPCINMSKFGALSVGCYPFLLFLNEPENVYDVNLTPAQAVPLVVAQQAHCPQTKLVMGNSMSVSWLQSFLAAFQTVTGHAYQGLLGYHAYCWNVANVCLTGLAQLPALGYRVWITEFNCLSCAPAEFQRLLSAIGLSPLVDRFAVYTNRQPCGPPDNCGWVLPGADLVNANGTLTANGQAYADWHISRSFLPVLSKPPTGYP